MKKTGIILLSIAFILFIVSVSCSNGSGKLVGVWSNEDDILGINIEFTKDGKMISKAMGFTTTLKYKVKSNNLIEITSDEKTETVSYEFKDDTLLFDGMKLKKVTQ